ncbi:RNA polymerase-associated protein RTF1 homolog [Halichondria panicea]|uniref:RNA polymerase-associated protein RTF1 homolog n=1 Tax=Halichondria panicea TaxID=6063 RepID=UPI00312B9426
MSKTKKRPIIRSDSEDSDGSENVDQEALSLTTTAVKRPKLSSPAAQSSGSDSSSESGSDNEWTVDGKSKGKKGRVPLINRGRGIGRKMIMGHKPSSESSDDEEDGDSEEEMPKPMVASGFSSSGPGQSSSSDSDSSSADSLQFDDGLDDELIGDEDDRSKLDQMTEAEREQEVFKRFEKRQALKTRFEIEQRLRKEKKAEKRRSKAKGKQRRPTRDTRVRQQDKSKSKAIDELKAKRSADKMRKAEAEKEEQSFKPLNAADIFSSDEESSSGTESSSSNADSEDDVGGKSLSALRRDGSKSITTLAQLNKIKLSRYRLEKWVHMPFFKDTAIGCYVRIGIGAHDGKMVYRVCRIVNIQEGPKVYSLGSTKTNKTLRLKHATQERQFRMEYVSNSQFSDTEFTKWLQELESQGMKAPSLEMVSKKTKQIEAAKNFSMNDKDIETIVKEKEKFRKNPRNYAMTKNRLIREKELAEVEGDQDRVGVLSTKIEENEERAEELDKQRNKGLSAISYINERNRQRNVTRSEQALKEEMAAADKDVNDPFTRRKCQPTLVTLTFREGGVSGNAEEQLQQLSQDKNQEKDPAKSTEKETASDLVGTASNGQPSTSAVTVPTPTSNVEDLFSAHDFDIQIDLPTGPEVPSTIRSVPKSVPTEKGSHGDGPKRSLNLSDYKKRRGLI